MKQCGGLFGGEKKFQGSFWKEGEKKIGVLKKMGEFVVLGPRGNGSRKKEKNSRIKSLTVFNIELIMCTAFIIKLLVLALPNAILLPELFGK